MNRLRSCQHVRENGGKDNETEEENEEENDKKEEKEKEGDDVGNERLQWNNSYQFFFTVLGFCVGLGNIWRFPYLCQQNGGGAFVIPFLVMMVLEGMPLLLLELSMGQKFQKSSLIVWHSIHPSLGGIGLASSVIATIVGIYYNVIIAWCLYYLFNSFKFYLPWTNCPLELKELNITGPVKECLISSETQYFWYRNTLDISESIEDFDGIRWWMLLSLTVSWLLIYLIVMKGISSSGKIVYFTALFPYVVLTIFFIRGLTLEGSFAGLSHMFYPKMEKLFSAKVWLDAANQVFYSYGLAFGSIISFGSYNPIHKNTIKDVYIITACNAFTALYASSVIFSILGFKAQSLFEKCLLTDISYLRLTYGLWNSRNSSSIGFDEYYHAMTFNSLNDSHLNNCSLENEMNRAAEGTGLAFIVMAEVFTKLPGSPFWSILFFSMLLSLGLGSQIGILEGVIGTLFDVPVLKHVKRPILTGVACTLCYLIGIVFTTGAGEYWVTLFDSYGALGLTLIALSEILSMSYVYGSSRFTNDIHFMTGTRPGLYWQITWRLVAPFILILILCLSIYSEVLERPVYSIWSKDKGESLKVSYPGWILGLALCLSLCSLVPILLVALLSVFQISLFGQEGNFKRVDTANSTKPILESSNNLEELHELHRISREFDDDDDEKTSESDKSDQGIFVEEKNRS